MKSVLKKVRLGTTEPIQVMDITTQIKQLLAESGVSNGQLTLISSHTTAFVSLNEFEPGLQQDMVEYLDRVAPPGAGYRHDVNPVDGRLNAHSHLAGLFLNPSLTIPIVKGRLLLGGWQSILFIELDGPRETRSLHVQILGVD
ncbi:MAG: YjbQ family protein [Chromatiaceae bacterium]|nr:YjbQ family protein [Chromatiaceae bacterium]